MVLQNNLLIPEESKVKRLNEDGTPTFVSSSVLDKLEANDFLKESNSFDNLVNKNPQLLNYNNFEDNKFLVNILGLEIKLDLKSNKINPINFSELSLFKQTSILLKILEKLNLITYINKKPYLHTINFLNFIKLYVYYINIEDLIIQNHNKTKTNPIKYSINKLDNERLIDVYSIPFNNITIDDKKILANYIVNIYFENKLIKKNYDILKTDYLFDIDLKDSNKFSKKILVKNHFTESFNHYMLTLTNSIFCADGFGSNFRNLLQRKATKVTIKLLKEEIETYIYSFNNLYKSHFKLLFIGYNLTELNLKKIKINLVIDVEDETYNLDVDGPDVSSSSIFT